MNTKLIMHQWAATLQRLLTHTHCYQVQALAAFSFAAACAQRSQLARLAAYVPSKVQPTSTLRRLKRLLANPRLDVQALCSQLAAWLGRWNAPNLRLVLLLDETPHANNWRVLKVSVCYRRRALPLVWRTDPLRGRHLKARVFEVLGQTADLIAQYCPQAEVLLLADRGLCWPGIIDFCLQHHWHYVLRAQYQTQFRWQDATGVLHQESLGALLACPGQSWRGTGEAFAKADWRPVNVMALWRAENKAAWFLVSDLKPSLHLVRWYGKRMWHEESFRDEKSAGFCWQESRLTKAERVHRLLLVLALAQLWLMFLGTMARRKPWARRLGLHTSWSRVRWSVFRSGWQLLRWCLDNDKKPPSRLHFVPF